MKYFVAYRWYFQDDAGWGRSEITCPRPITSMAEIKEIEKLIAADRSALAFGTKVIVTGWQPFEKDEA